MALFGLFKSKEEKEEERIDLMKNQEIEFIESIKGFEHQRSINLNVENDNELSEIIGKIIPCPKSISDCRSNYLLLKWLLVLEKKRSDGISISQKIVSLLHITDRQATKELYDRYTYCNNELITVNKCKEEIGIIKKQSILLAQQCLKETKYLAVVEALEILKALSLDTFEIEIDRMFNYLKYNISLEIEVLLYLKDYAFSSEHKMFIASAFGKRISTRINNSAIVNRDGTIIVVGEKKRTEFNNPKWKDIVAVSLGVKHIVGLDKHGRVYAVGDWPNKIYRQKLSYNSRYGEDGECNVWGWRNIVAISAGWKHTVGLKADGTVVATGGFYGNPVKECEVSYWRDIIAISAGSCTLGLKKDGTVVAAGSNSSGECNVSDWKDIVAISAGGSSSFGLKKDGTVVRTHLNESGVQSKSEPFWNDIVAISGQSPVGLKRDGTIESSSLHHYSHVYMSNGKLRYTFDDIPTWKDIISLSCSRDHIVAIKKDGTVIASGQNKFGECNISGLNI